MPTETTSTAARTDVRTADQTAEDKAAAKKVAAAMKDVEVGDTVHYVWPDSGHHHAAFVANVLDPERGYVTLSVLDHNGGFMQSPWTAYDPDGAPGTWHPKEEKAGDQRAEDKLDPAGLNIGPDGRTGVAQGLQAEGPAFRDDAERAAEAVVPRAVAKDDPVGHRTIGVAEATGNPDAVDRSAVTETAGERAQTRLDEHGTRSTEPAARNAANEPSARFAAERAARADAEQTRTTSSAARTETRASARPGTETSARSADREANRATESNSAKTDKKD